MWDKNPRGRGAGWRGPRLSALCGPVSHPQHWVRRNPPYAAEPQLAHATIKETMRGSYRVHEIQQSSGTVIREYAGLDGKVFAVTWHGPFSPNLRQTLGSYFDQYAAAAPAGRQDRNHVQVRTSNLVVQVGGHMRAYSGRAYLPQALPSGVTAGDLE